MVWDGLAVAEDIFIFRRLRRAMQHEAQSPHKPRKRRANLIKLVFAKKEFHQFLLASKETRALSALQGGELNKLRE